MCIRDRSDSDGASVLSQPAVSLDECDAAHAGAVHAAAACAAVALDAGLGDYGLAAEAAGDAGFEGAADVAADDDGDVAVVLPTSSSGAGGGAAGARSALVGRSGRGRQRHRPARLQQVDGGVSSPAAGARSDA